MTDQKAFDRDDVKNKLRSRLGALDHVMDSVADHMTALTEPESDAAQVPREDLRLLVEAIHAYSTTVVALAAIGHVEGF